MRSNVVLRGQVKLDGGLTEWQRRDVATLGPGDFFGEGCMAGCARRTATATSMSACRVTRVEKAAMTRVLHDSPELADAFMASLMSRIISYEADLVDHMFNSSAKRLARVLLRLSHLA
jgi:CRP-like cAMP-binding protein